MAALGVVFGDIGTSPLYALQTVFSLDHNEVRPTPGDVYGVLSLVFWSITLVVSVKYVSVVYAIAFAADRPYVAFVSRHRRDGPHHRDLRRVARLGYSSRSASSRNSSGTPLARARAGR